MLLENNELRNGGLTKKEWALVRKHERSVAEERDRKIALRVGALEHLRRKENQKYKHKCPACGAYRSTKEALRLHIKWEHK